jgi:hypothetical protein
MKPGLAQIESPLVDLIEHPAHLSLPSSPVTFTNTKKSSFRAPYPPRPTDCRNPRLVPTRAGPVWKRCNRPKCCRVCRDGWAWKQASAVQQSVAERPPTHFLTIHKRLGVFLTDAAFSKALGRFFLALGRRVSGKLEYLVVNEWSKGVRHAHALVLAPGGIPRRACREAAAATGELLRITCETVHNPLGAVSYLFKHTRRRDRKAELPPVGFRGRLFTSSRGFLVRPIEALWREFRASRGHSTDDADEERPQPARMAEPSSRVSSRNASSTGEEVEVRKAIRKLV